MACKYKSRVWENGWCNVACRYCTFTQESTCAHNKQTNADRIRAMSDEELAEWLVEKTVYQESAWSKPTYLNFLTSRNDTKENAINGTAEWLQQPAEGE